MILENLWSISRLPTSLQHSKNHDILLKKLEHYGICDKSNKWLRSFLEGRKQHTTINKTRSSDKLISIGVPQGLILSPILFILFINDFHKAVDFSTVHHFADDTNLLLTENSLKKLNKHINRDLCCSMDPSK